MDITTLGIAVDSRPVDQATRSMNDMTSAAKRVEQATSDMGRETSRSAGEAAEQTNKLEKALRSAATQGVVIGQAISEGMRIAVQGVKALDAMITKVGDMQDLADMTGASAAGLSRMRIAADVAGTSIDGVANMMVMMTRQLSAVSDESKGAGKALEVLGIDVDKFRLLRGDEQFRLLAERLKDVEDSGGKTALILDIVGRGGAEAAKLFKALGDESNITRGYTEEMISAMDDYADANTRARSQMGMTLELLAVEMSPAFAAFRESLMDTILALMGVGKESTNLAKDRGALEFARAVGLGLSHVIDLATKAVLNLVALGKVIGAVAAAGAAIVGGQGMAGVRAVMEGLNEDIAKLRERANFSTAESFEKRFNEIVNGEKKVTSEVDKALSDRVRAHQRANEAVTQGDRNGLAARRAAEREAERDRKKEIEERIKTGRMAAMAEGDALIKANEEYQAKLEAARKLQAESDSRSVENSKNEVNAINAQAEALENQVRNRGRLRSAIEAETLALMKRDRQEFEGSEQSLALLDQKIAAQERLVEAIQGQEVAEASDKAAKHAEDAFSRAWDNVSESLIDAIMRGGMSAKEWLQQTFNNLVLRPILQAGMDSLGAALGMGGKGGVGSLLPMIGGGGQVANLFTNFSGSASNVAFNMGYNMMNNGFEKMGTTLMNNANLIGKATNILGSGLNYISAFKDAKEGKWGSAVGTTAGTIFGGPIGGVVGGALGGLLDNLFGWGKKKVPNFSGAAGMYSINSNGGPGNPHQFDPQMQQLVKTMEGTFKQFAGTLNAFRTDMQYGAYMIQKEGNTRWGVRDARGVEVTGNSANADVQAAMSNAMVDLIVDGLQASTVNNDVIAYFKTVSQGLAGEAKLAALQQVVELGKVRDSLTNLGMSTWEVGEKVSNIAFLSLQATANLAQFSGGLQNLSSNLATFHQNFYSAQEQMAMGYKSLAQQMNAAGSGWHGADAAAIQTWSKDFFRNMVEGINLTTEMGQRQYATVLAMSGQFAQLKAAEEAEAARWRAEEERKAAEWRAQQEEAARRWEAERDKRMSAYQKALGDLSSAYERQKAAVTATRDRLLEVTKSFRDMIANLKTDSNLSTLSPTERLAQLSADYEKAKISAVRDNFSGDSAARAQEAARAYLEAARGMYGSGEQYTTVFNKIVSEMETGAVLAQHQANVADEELVRLDQQVDYLARIHNTLLGVSDAIINFNRTREEYAQFTGGYPHALGLPMVPYDGYPATLHKGEAVLTSQENNVIRSLPSLVTVMREVNSQLTALRRENRQDAGSTIQATTQTVLQAARIQTEAALKTAQKRAYYSSNTSTNLS